MAARTRWWSLVVTLLALAAAAPPASAAFPGANGRLVLTPSSGSGVLIASPRTGRARRVCAAPQRCGTRPAQAAFSPNGREIVFSTRGGRLELTTATGTCVWCLASLPRVVLHGTSPAFTPGGETITYVNHGLWEVKPGGGHATRLHVITVQVSSGAASAAAWSDTGRVAVVRGGWVWTGVRNADNVVLSKRLARGSAPAWSPDGRELAFTRRGVVFTIRTPGHKLTRIARGSAPAFSPDGRALAYLNARHQVAIRSLGRTRTRTLTRLRGRSLDWQPVTTITRRGCAAANGVPVASTTSATIRQAANPHGGNIGWNGCLTALGIPFHLNGGLDGDGYDLALGHVALAGNFAAMQFVYTDKYMNYADTINVYDLRNGTLVHSEPVSCLRMPCDVTSLAVNAQGFSAWHSVQTSETPEPNLTAISCPSAALCVAGDQSGYLLVSTAPTKGRAAWTRLSLASSSATPIRGVSCPTTALCVAITSNGTVYSSTDPTGGAAAWHTASLGAPAVVSVSCGSASLCVAVGFQTAYVTTDPTGPASAWSAHTVSSIPTSLQTVSCASDTLCVIGDSNGDLLSSTDLADPTPSWSVDHVASLINGVDCPTSGLCAAVAIAVKHASGTRGAIAVTSTDPAANTWTAQPLPSLAWNVTCTGTSLCLAFGGVTLATTTDPADPSPSWTQTTTTRQLDTASCPTTSLCIGAGGSNIVTSGNPTGGPSAWTGALVDALDCDPCLSETLTALDGHGAHTEDNAPPGPGTHIAGLGFTGSTLTWIHDGAARSAALS